MSQTVDALKLYVKELEKLAVKYQAKRDKEIAKVEQKFGDIEFDRDGLADAYGYGNLTRAEYEAALDLLEKNESDKNVGLEIKTVTSEILRMIRADMRSINTETEEMEADG